MINEGEVIYMSKFSAEPETKDAVLWDNKLWRPTPHEWVRTDLVATKDVDKQGKKVVEKHFIHIFKSKLSGLERTWGTTYLEFK